MITLKPILTASFFEKFCPVLGRKLDNFDSTRFIHLIFDNRWPDLDSAEQVAHVTRVLNKFLPEDRVSAINVLYDLNDELMAFGEVWPEFDRILRRYMATFGRESISRPIDQRVDHASLVA